MAKTRGNRRAKARSRNRRAQPRTMTGRVIEALPAPVERMPAIRRAFELLEDRELRAAEIGETWRVDLENAVDRIQTDVAERFEGIESRTEREARSLFRRLRATKLAKAIRGAPKQITRRFDGVLLGLGLIRRSRHDDLLAQARRRARRQKPSKRTAPSPAAA